MKLIQRLIFGSRWILVPFYLGLIVAQLLYCVKFVQSVWELINHFLFFDETQMMLAVLALIDIVMIANLLKMIISGSYQTFVDKTQSPAGEKVTSGLLKVKMGSSLVGVSSIHLLQVFITPDAITDREIYAKVGIHLVFLISTIGLAYIDYLHSKSEILHEKAESKAENNNGRNNHR